MGAGQAEYRVPTYVGARVVLSTNPPSHSLGDGNRSPHPRESPRYLSHPSANCCLIAACCSCVDVFQTFTCSEPTAVVSDSDIDNLHKRFVAETVRLFERTKESHGLAKETRLLIL
jgi:hypothetical protein